MFVLDGVLQGAAEFDYLAVAMAASAGGALTVLALLDNGSGAGGDGLAAAGVTLGTGSRLRGVSAAWSAMGALQIGRGLTLGARYFSGRGALAVTPTDPSTGGGGVSVVETEEDSRGVVK